MKHHPQMGGSHGRFIAPVCVIDARAAQKITRHMFHQQLIVGNVLIQCADEVITIFPCVRNGGITFAAMGFGIPYPIHPMTCPSLAVLGRIQKGIDPCFIGHRVWVEQVAAEFFR